MTILIIPLVALCLLVVVGVFLRVNPARVPGVRFKETSADHAFDLISGFSNGTYDARFGYPSGFFSFNEKRSAPGRKLVFNEAHPSGTVSDGCAFSIGSVAFDGMDGGCLSGAVMFMMVACIAAPFVAVSLADRLIRHLLQSSVVVTLSQDGRDVVADLAFHGISGYLVKPKYVRALATPVLPISIFSPPPPPTEQASAAA